MTTALLLPMRQTNENFGNLRATFFNKSNCSDLVLGITDVGSSLERLEIHAHRLVLCSASAYLQSCLTSVMNQQNLVQYNNGSASSALVPNKLKLKIEIDFATNQLSNEAVNLFFSLFYVNRFDKAHLESENLTVVVEYHILELYELACFFFFDALIVYIEQYFLEGMCLSYFSPLFGFCLTVDSATTTNTNAVHYKIIPSKAHLFSRLLQWYQCCIDPLAPATPFQSLPTEMGTEYFLYHKEVILSDFSQRIENLEACKVPRHQVSLLGSEGQGYSKRIRLSHYHKICSACLYNNRKNNTVNAYYYTDLGSLKKTYRNGSETFFFRVKRRVPSNRDSMPPRSTNNTTIELTCVREYTKKRARTTLNNDEEEHEWLAEEEEEEEEETSSGYTCESEVTLLSRKRQNDIIDHTYKESDISRPTAISHFPLHKPKYCYEAHCDHCRVKKPVYVFILNLTLSKEADAPAEEMMGMQVEESTSYI